MIGVGIFVNMIGSYRNWFVFVLLFVVLGVNVDDLDRLGKRNVRFIECLYISFIVNFSFFLIFVFSVCYECVSFWFFLFCWY